MKNEGDLEFLLEEWSKHDPGFFALCAVQTVLSQAPVCVFYTETLSHGMLLNSAWYSKNLEVKCLSLVRSTASKINIFK